MHPSTPGSAHPGAVSEFQSLSDARRLDFYPGVRGYTRKAIPAVTLVRQGTEDASMVQAAGTPPAGLRIGELEAQYPQYCKAMRMLIRGGADLAKVKRTVCWERLALLHASLPRQYRDPELLFLHLRRELGLQGSAA